MNVFPENLTIVVLLGLGITAAWALGAEAKDVLIAIASGLVGYLTRASGGTAHGPKRAINKSDTEEGEESR